jgi:hypothetical protein
MESHTCRKGMDCVDLNPSEGRFRTATQKNNTHKIQMKIERAPQYFLTAKAEFFDRLSRELHLVDVQNTIYSQFGYTSAVAGSVRVFLEYERGGLGFSLGPNGDLAPMCDVETIADRFPRVRKMPDGNQRLSLDEQLALIVRHWSELQKMFDPTNLAETRKWMMASGSELMAKYTRAGG